MRQTRALGIGILNALGFISAVSCYRGADNRLVSGAFPEERGGRLHHERRPPDIEYHYPDMSNQISRQPPGPWRPHQDAQPQPQPQPQPGSWRKAVPSVGFVNHVKVERRRPGHHQHHHQLLPASGLYRTTQWGTARIPYLGAAVSVVPAPARRKTYRGLVTTTVLSPEEARRGRAPPLHDPPVATSADPAGRGGGLAQDEPAAPEPCHRCPADRAVAAPRGSMFAPLEKPALKPCHQSAWSPEVKLELLSGVRPGFPLSEGAHVISGRIVWRGKTLGTCRFRYNVVVRRCPPLVLPDHLTANCSAEDAWGSECVFSCGRGFQALGAARAACADDLRWSQPPPLCTPATGCSLPPTPENGKLSCKISDEDPTDLLAEGTTCRYLCNDGFHLPSHGHHATIACSAGEWNTTRHTNCLGEQRARRPEPLGRPPPPPPPAPARRRHRKQRSGRGRAADPCRPSPCGVGRPCRPGPQPFLALCACADQPRPAPAGCQTVVLVRRLLDKRHPKEALVIGNLLATQGPETEDK